MANLNPVPRPENLRPPWGKGETGNPQGHSKKRRLSDAIKRKLCEPGCEAELIDSWFREAVNGSYQHLREILDRTEGKVANKVEVKETRVDWSDLDNEGDTERPTNNPSRIQSLPQEDEA
jgi:hypothetical protein